MVGVAFADLVGPPLEIGPLNRTAAEGILRQVDDRPAKVSVERLGLSQVVQAADEPEECLLDQILGERTVARQEVGEPEPGRGRPLVDLGDWI